MARWFALPFAALLIVALVLRAGRPSPPPPLAEARVAEETTDVPETAPAPAPLPRPPSPPPSTAFVEPTLSAEELRPLVEARFADETILAYARVTGRPFKPTPDELGALRQAGMSDALFGRLAGVPAPEPQAPAPPPVIHVTPAVTVYAPVTVTVVEAPPPLEPEPFISTVVLDCACHGRPGCRVAPDLSRPAIYQKPPTFKTHEYMPTKRLPTAEEVARREEARAGRLTR
jgi:hypothetical protein